MKKLSIAVISIVLVVSLTYQSFAIGIKEVSGALKGIDSVTLFENGDNITKSGILAMFEGQYKVKEGLHLNASVYSAPNISTQGLYHQGNASSHPYEMDGSIGGVEAAFILEGYEDGHLTLNPFIAYRASNSHETIRTYDGRPATTDWTSNTMTTALFAGVQGIIPLTQGFNMQASFALTPNVLQKSVHKIDGQKGALERSGMGGEVDLKVTYDLGEELSLSGGYQTSLIKFTDAKDRNSSLYMGASWQF